MIQRVLPAVIFGLILASLSASSARATFVRMETPLGAIDIELYEEQAPITSANFLQYVEAGRYDDSIIHRSIPNFVIQGGGFIHTFDPIEAFPAIPNEAGITNARGTIALAHGLEPDSGTSQWYINLIDNPFLDTQRGGYAVFGRVQPSDMEVVDRLAALPVIFHPTERLNDFPVLDESEEPFGDNLVTVRSAYIVPEPTTVGIAAASLILVLPWAARNKRTMQSPK